jgi:hypothetical protein
LHDLDGISEVLISQDKNGYLVAIRQCEALSGNGYGFVD